MNWLRGFWGNAYSFWADLGTPLYDQGYKDGYREGQDDGHEHGACEHTHPFDEALRSVAYGGLSSATFDDERGTDKRGY